MMYESSNGYVIAILSNNKVLREESGKVFLPFNTEYKIRIKNSALARVGFTVDVDGTSITDGKIILDRCETFDLERMVFNGDLNNGPKLLFVPCSDNRVQDPTNNENGIITVKFYKEFSHSFLPNFYPYSPLFYTNHYPNTSNSGLNRKLSTSTNCHNEQNYSCSVENTGATVSGSSSSQSFEQTEFNSSEIPNAILTLKIVGKKVPHYVKNTRYMYCTSCGKKIKKSNNFCSSCGAANN